MLMAELIRAPAGLSFFSRPKRLPLLPRGDDEDFGRAAICRRLSTADDDDRSGRRVAGRCRCSPNLSRRGAHYRAPSTLKKKNNSTKTPLSAVEPSQFPLTSNINMTLKGPNRFTFTERYFDLKEVKQVFPLLMTKICHQKVVGTHLSLVYFHKNSKPAIS